MSRRPGIVGGMVLLVLGAVGLAVFRGGVESKPEPASPVASARPPGTGALVERLRRTNLLNGEEIYREPGLGEASFFDAPEVQRWYSSRRGNAEVCAVRFTEAAREDYRLRTFPDEESARSADHLITHRSHCGTCSSLRNLAAYLARRDLTSPARNCARRLTVAGMKACFMEDLGFDERCAETWTGNALHTRRHCLGVCIGHYGLWNVLTGDMGAPNTDGAGNLNPCLACDERVSGPGFQYAAGRTRRNSGLTSAITRPMANIYPVDHRRYFR
ncbi:MAG: hypothetical protein F4Z74_10780 [Acidobacteria bacterium]|nr:hypothetical protein [Acidobacteriota bacterium]MYE44480.1 hypothetical protein [Acidobacteriota bacterium]